MNRSPELELLAPARDANIGIEAINHGADAVYIGGPSFGARASAGNDVAEIERLVRHAHRFNARIFVTLNTILRDDELEPARRMVQQVYEAGADALIVQDMGLLEMDLPPIQLHASTQTDIRTPEKARFLEDVGFAQIVVARELTLPQIQAIANKLDRAKLEFFVHGALCVAYSGQCFISHAHTGRSANRGDCSQACRLPYTVTDAAGRIVAHDKHVLSMKDNNQSANLAALIDAGVRSFKIEGRYKDMGYVKNITAHYRKLLDEVLATRPALQPASSGKTTFTFTPDPDQNFNRGSTDYFVNGRQEDIGAFDSPKHAGVPLGWVTKVGKEHFDLELDDGVPPLHNGDGLTYFDLQQELVGVQLNTVSPLDNIGRRWRVMPNELMTSFKDLRVNTVLKRNRDMAWVRGLEKKSSERRIPVALHLTRTAAGLALSAQDSEGHRVTVHATHALDRARDSAKAEASLRDNLSKLGTTIFNAPAEAITLGGDVGACFVPTSVINPLRREAIEALEAERLRALPRLAPLPAVEPPALYPEDSLSYLANVFNHKAFDFYAKHGVKVIEAAYESHEELGEVSLMITKHCVRFSLSLCPKQAKGVMGVQGTIRAEPLSLINGNEKLTLRFDCKPCEMHVVGKMKRSVINQAHQASQAAATAVAPITFYRQRPVSPRS
ncbi:MAG: U32 family peptidase [Leptothrix ochracea]|uniref:peptidase U32 family protein n=1 Tax=Leptothrix ochracea TaxID=735331 RepID=UPI0034E25F9F